MVNKKTLFTDISRQKIFEQWLRWVAQTLETTFDFQSLHHASADASARRYFRLSDVHSNNYIIMDAPDLREQCKQFVQVADLMHSARLRVPKILAWDEEHGFMLLTDLGQRTLLQYLQGELVNAKAIASETRLKNNNATRLKMEGEIDNPLWLAPTPVASQKNLIQPFYHACEHLVQWQLATKPDILPVYDQAFIARELALFEQWYVCEYKKIELSNDQKNTLKVVFETLTKRNLQDAKVFMHRDYMARNLMVQPDACLGILDFQDAVYGPITYDIASLMRDAFLSWEEEFVVDVTVRYWEKARHANLPVNDDFGQFYAGVEWMALQRHLKILGIFARLSVRDGKAHYVHDTPRFIQYIRHTCLRYSQLKPLLRLIDSIESIKEDNHIFGFGRQM